MLAALCGRGLSRFKDSPFIKLINFIMIHHYDCCVTAGFLKKDHLRLSAAAVVLKGLCVHWQLFVHFTQV